MVNIFSDRNPFPDGHRDHLRVGWKRRYRLIKVLLLLAVFLRTSSKGRILEASTPPNGQVQREIYCRDKKALYKYSKLSRQALSLLYTQLQFIYNRAHCRAPGRAAVALTFNAKLPVFTGAVSVFFRFLVWTTTQRVHFSSARRYT